MSYPTIKKQLGQLLVDSQKITAEQLDTALKYQREHDTYLGSAIQSLGFISEPDLMEFLSDQLELPFMSLEDFTITPEALAVISDTTARRFNIIPLFFIGNDLTIAISDPLNINAIDAAARESGMDIELVVCTETDIQNAQDAYYGTNKYIGELRNDTDQDDIFLDTLSPDINDETKVVEAVDMMIRQAVRLGASDIHFEPREKDVRIRFRIDGILYENYTIPKDFQPPVTSRIKIMSQLNIAETRKPQDGRINFTNEGKKVDLRVSTYPAYYGEKIVMRVLDDSRAQISLDKIGFDSGTLEEWKKLIRKPNGIIMVTGPTGSGKTTTLYSTLLFVNSTEKNIITIEDPIEYEIDNINQGQVNPKIGVTFSAALRSILRQDPDIIMVGEMRDKETIDLAIRSSLTGHLVFSTLHTNDSVSAISRMIDMGIEPYLIASTVRGILAQRLVRTLCPKCKAGFKAPQEMIERLKLPKNGEYKFYKPVGCLHCRKTGYAGRTAIFELLIMDDKLISMVVKNESTDEIRREAVKRGMRQLSEQGLDKVLKGLTSVEEVLEITSLEM